MQAKTNNPAVREAACTCLAEAAAKVDAAIVEPHLQRIMRTLLVCFRDEAWPVSHFLPCCISLQKSASGHEWPLAIPCGFAPAAFSHACSLRHVAACKV